MAKRLIGVLGFVLFFGLVVQVARADDPPGAKLYATYCAGCHGAAGIGGFAPAIGDAKYLSAHDDSVIAQITRDGVTNKGMPTWGKSKGGTLTDEQITDIIAYLRSPASSATTATSTATAPSPQTSAATDVVYAQTKLAMTQSLNSDGALVVVATLTKFDGSPVSGQVIAFTRTTLFGVIELGTAKTDNSGKASLVVTEESPEGAREITATFKGDEAFGSSQALITPEQPMVVLPSHINLASVRLSIGDEPLLPSEGSLITPNPPLAPTLIFLSVVGCIWATYGFVIYQVSQIWKSGQNRVRQNTLTIRSR